MPIKRQEQEIINYCHERALSAFKVALVSGDGTQIVTVPIASPDATIVRISAFSNDAGLLRVSSLGGTFSLSADASGNRVSCIQQDASNLRISAIVDSGSVSAINLAANNFRVSAMVDSGSVSAKSSDATNFRVSAIIDNGSVSAKSSDASFFRISAFNQDAGLLRVSTVAGSGDILPSVIFANRKIISSSASAEVVGTATLTVGVIIKALSANLSACYLGTSAVLPSNAMYELQPQEATSVAVNSLSAIFLAVQANNDGVEYIGS